MATKASHPAVYFYYRDFLDGVQDLTMEERGQYITLLCLQASKGTLTDKAIKLAVGNVSDDVMSKFEKDEEGFYHARMEEEVVRANKRHKSAKGAADARWNNEDSNATAYTSVNANAYANASKPHMLFNNIAYAYEYALELVFEYLNENNPKTYDCKAKGNRKHLEARIKEGATLEEIINVVRYKCAEWVGDEKMEKYLRPQTLFNSEKYPDYDATAKSYQRRGLTPEQVYQSRRKGGGGSDVRAYRDAVKRELLNRQTKE